MAHSLMKHSNVERVLNKNEKDPRQPARLVEGSQLTQVGSHSSAHTGRLTLVGSHTHTKGLKKPERREKR